MIDLARKIVRFLLDEEGPAAIEYALAFLLILLTVLTVVLWLGQATGTLAG